MLHDARMAGSVTLRCNFRSDDEGPQWAGHVEPFEKGAQLRKAAYCAHSPHGLGQAAPAADGSHERFHATWIIIRMTKGAEEPGGDLASDVEHRSTGAQEHRSTGAQAGP